MTNFTKGPWAMVDLGAQELESREFIIGPEGKGAASFNEEMIASVWSPEHDAEANAHLISAAPDMYEALENMLDDYETVVDGWRDPEAVRVGKQFVAAAESALAKARGES